jgi:cation transport ATPase
VRAAIGENLHMAKKRAHRPEGFSPAPKPDPRASKPAGSRPPTVHAARSSSARGGARARFERASAPLLLSMQALPTFLVPMLLAVLLFLGLVIQQPWAGAFLVVIAVFLSWLTAVSWPAISAGSRLMRVLVNLGVLGLGVLKILGRI